MRLSFRGSRVLSAFGTGGISGTLERSSVEADFEEVLAMSSLTWFGVSSAVFMSEF